MTKILNLTEIPFVIFAFNRPDKLNMVLNSIKTQEVKNLIFFVDAPRNDVDEPKVDACKKLIMEISWAKKELVFHKKNRGLSGILKDLDDVFDNHNAAVIVEDDCLPMPGFKTFALQALEHYIDNEKVFSIGGYQPLAKKNFRYYPHSLMSTPRFICWGWASWCDRWKALKNDRDHFLELFDDLDHIPSIVGEDVIRHARMVAQGKLTTSWDNQVAIAMLWQQKVTLLPSYGLIKNIGLIGGMHGKSEYDPFHNINLDTSQVIQEMKWIENVEPLQEYNQQMLDFVDRILHPRWHIRLLRKIYRIPIHLKLDLKS